MSVGTWGGQELRVQEDGEHVLLTAYDMGVFHRWDALLTPEVARELAADLIEAADRI